MSSEFTQLCEMYGLSPGDPEAIDILIEELSEPDDNDNDDDNDFNYEAEFDAEHARDVALEEKWKDIFRSR